MEPRADSNQLSCVCCSRCSRSQIHLSNDVTLPFVASCMLAAPLAVYGSSVLEEQSDKNQVEKAKDGLRKQQREQKAFIKTKILQLEKPPSQSMGKKPAQAQGGCMATGGDSGSCRADP
eukprot:6184553-Pleurochrysis_carterae.AAC.4